MSHTFKPSQDCPSHLLTFSGQTVCYSLELSANVDIQSQLFSVTVFQAAATHGRDFKKQRFSFMLVSASQQYECYSCWDYEGSFVLTPSDKHDRGFKKLAKGRYHLVVTVQWDPEVDEDSRNIRMVLHSPVSIAIEQAPAESCVSLLRSVLLKHADTS